MKASLLRGQRHNWREQSPSCLSYDSASGAVPVVCIAGNSIADDHLGFHAVEVEAVAHRQSAAVTMTEIYHFPGVRLAALALSCIAIGWLAGVLH